MKKKFADMSIYQYTNNRMGIYSTANWHISQLTDAPIIQTYKPYDYERPLPDGESTGWYGETELLRMASPGRSTVLGNPGWLGLS